MNKYKKLSLGIISALVCGKETSEEWMRLQAELAQVKARADGEVEGQMFPKLTPASDRKAMQRVTALSKEENTSGAVQAAMGQELNKFMEKVTAPLAEVIAKVRKLEEQVQQLKETESVRAQNLMTIIGVALAAFICGFWVGCKETSVLW